MKQTLFIIILLASHLIVAFGSVVVGYQAADLKAEQIFMEANEVLRLQHELYQKSAEVNREAGAMLILTSDAFLITDIDELTKLTEELQTKTERMEGLRDEIYELDTQLDVFMDQAEYFHYL